VSAPVLSTAAARLGVSRSHSDSAASPDSTASGHSIQSRVSLRSQKSARAPVKGDHSIAGAADADRTWQFVSGVCRIGEKSETAALRMFREKAVRLGDDCGFTAHCLQSAVCGAAFGSKSDPIGRGSQEVRISKMMTVVLTVPPEAHAVPAGMQ
jgi:hypothetical protein